MSAKYWIAKHVDDPFRNEPRNVGVIASVSASFHARFVGEREDGTYDGRRIGNRLRHPTVYTQWLDFWRDALEHSDIAEIVASTTDNFYVVYGGEVSDIGSDTAKDVCAFLYNLLVTDASPAEAFAPSEVEAVARTLQTSIADEFARFHLLASAPNLLARHPIEKDAQITGRTFTHTPSFSQRNGHLSVMEYLDLDSRHTNKMKERAGWMAYMYGDILSAEPTADAYSIIQPSEGQSEAVAYAQAAVGSRSKLVNWANAHEREAFLSTRRRVADHV